VRLENRTHAKKQKRKGEGEGGKKMEGQKKWKGKKMEGQKKGRAKKGERGSF